jgi:phage tail-like protein
MAVAGIRLDPIPAFRFNVFMDNFVWVGGFTECSGLQLEVEVQDYPEGGLNTYIHKFPGRSRQSNIVLKRGIVDRLVWQWFYEVSSGIFVPRSGSIVVQDPSGFIPVMTYNFQDAFPLKWTGPELNASQNNVATETLELCHQGLVRIL